MLCNQTAIDGPSIYDVVIQKYYLKTNKQKTGTKIITGDFIAWIQFLHARDLVIIPFSG